MLGKKEKQGGKQIKLRINLAQLLFARWLVRIVLIETKTNLGYDNRSLYKIIKGNIIFSWFYGQWTKA